MPWAVMKRCAYSSLSICMITIRGLRIRQGRRLWPKLQRGFGASILWIRVAALPAWPVANAMQVRHLPAVAHRRPDGQALKRIGVEVRMEWGSGGWAIPAADEANCTGLWPLPIASISMARLQPLALICACGA
jgi:hypothetical protein